MSIPVPRHEPHKIKTVRLVDFPGLEERRRNLAAAHFNVVHLRPSQITFDLCSAGTGAMSQEQLSGQLLGDEAYAGARNFENLQHAATTVLGHTYVCPTHNLLGSVKLVCSTSIAKGAVVPVNGRGRMDVLEPRGLRVADVRDHGEAVFTGNVDLARLEQVARDGRASHVFVHAFADGQHPFSLANLRDVRALCDRYGLKLVLDCSRVVENAWYIQHHESGLADRPIAELVKRLAKNAHVAMIDGGQDPRSNTGGLLLTDNPADHEKFTNEVVVYEGLHTYGGMSGRTMEVLARGLAEMVDEAQAQWIMHQNETFTAKLRAAGLPLERGCDGAYLLADRFLPHVKEHPEHALAAALYQTAGVRAAPFGLVGRDHVLAVQIPRLAMTNRQLELVGDAILAVWTERGKVPALEAQGPARWHDQLRFRGDFADLREFEWQSVYPFFIHTVERTGELSRDQRERAMREAGWNTFLLRSADVTIDLLTDSGTSAMSTDQWAAYDAARASPCPGDASRTFVETMRDVYGFEHVIPTHQGRAAEHILSQTMIRPGQIVPGNMYFTTTREHQELAGGRFVDVIVDEAHDSQSEHPWKGDIDLRKVKALVADHGAKAIAYVKYEFSVNMAGGQPCSMDNVREVSAYCRSQGIPVCFDATRAVENAYMIQKRDPRYRRTHVRDILREMMMHGDACTVSGKKDYLVNIGGMLGFRESADLKARAEEMLRVYEGGVGDGGLAAADLAAMARGVREMLDDRYIRSRVEQTGKLGRMLAEAGVPIVQPPGSFAIFVDAHRFLPHVDQDEFPAQRLAAEIFVETGVRAMERGNVSKGRDPATGRNYRPALELVRLTIPRRVYTHDHMRAVADGIIRLYQRRDAIKGLKFVYEPAHLRFFQARFAPVE